MRLKRLAPATAGVLRDGLLNDPGALVEGLRWLATEVPVPGQAPIEALGVDGRGRLMVVGFAMSADAAAIEQALSRWRWLVSALPAIRALAPPDGIDFAADPRLALAASRVLPEGLQLAACIGRPRIEIYEVALVFDGERQGILVEEAGRGREELAAAPPPQSELRVPLQAYASAMHGVPGKEASRSPGAAEPVELTSDEIAEFRKLGVRAPAPQRIEPRAIDAGAGNMAPNSAGAAGPKFVEN